jgi:hypothetical protein
MLPKRIAPVFAEELHKHQFIQFIYVTDAAGRNTICQVTQPKYRDEFGTVDMTEDLSDRDWFIGAVESGSIYITDFYLSRFTGVLCITVSAPIIDENGQLLGVIGADLQFAELVRMQEQFL